MQNPFSIFVSFVFRRPICCVIFALCCEHVHGDEVKFALLIDIRALYLCCCHGILCHFNVVCASICIYFQFFCILVVSTLLVLGVQNYVELVSKVCWFGITIVLDKHANFSICVINNIMYSDTKLNFHYYNVIANIFLVSYGLLLHHIHARCIVNKYILCFNYVSLLLLLLIII
jgi:hypothetical protein